MTTRALLIMIPTWGIIIYYTARYFYLVLRSKAGPSDPH